MIVNDKDSVVVNGLLQCLVNIGNEVGVAPEEQLNGSLEIIAAIREIKTQRDALAADRADLIKELAPCQNVLHQLAHTGQCSPGYANDAREVLQRVTCGNPPTFDDRSPNNACLARRDKLKQADGMKKAAAFIEKKADDYDAEHGSTDPSTGHREYPGDGAEYYNELMELADELRQQAEGHQ